MTPIPQRVNVDHVQGSLKTLGDIAQATRDLSCHEFLSPPWRLVTKEYAVPSIHTIRLKVVHRDRESIELGYHLGASRMERSVFVLGCFLNEAKKFRRRGLIKKWILFSSPRHRIASSRRNAPIASTSAVYERVSKLTLT